MMELSTHNGQHRGGTKQISWPEIAAGVATSVGIHGLIVTIAVITSLWASSGEPVERYDVVFDDVELLALGDIRDSQALPRITGDEPPPAAEDEVVLDDRPDEPPEPQPEVEAEPEAEPDPDALRREREEREAREEAERQRRREERQRRMDEALGRFEEDGPGDDAPEGSPDGVSGGTVSDEALANMMQTYQVRILQEIQRYWEVPVTISDSDLQELAGRARVRVRLAENGHVVSFQFLTRSGNDQFDDSIERVLRRFEPRGGGRTLPMPDQADLRREVIREGLILTNWEITN